MNQIKRVIFVDGDGISRAPMAAAIFGQLYPDTDKEVLSRGTVVSFPQPLNQKVEAVMVSNNVMPEGFVARQLEETDIDDSTIIFVMEETQKNHVLGKQIGATDSNTFVLSEYVGDELEILDPYGGPLQTYGICFEILRTTIQKLLKKWEAL